LPTQCVIHSLREPLALVLDIPDGFFHCQADKRQPGFAVCGKGTMAERTGFARIRRSKSAGARMGLI
jgi:hypothetical protein